MGSKPRLAIALKYGRSGNSMDMQDLIKRINELAHKAKNVGLNEDEKAEQKMLRSKYIELFRGNLKAQLDSIVIVDENGSKTKLKQKPKQNRGYLN